MSHSGGAGRRTYAGGRTHGRKESDERDGPGRVPGGRHDRRGGRGAAAGLPRAAAGRRRAGARGRRSRDRPGGRTLLVAQAEAVGGAGARGAAGGGPAARGRVAGGVPRVRRQAAAHPQQPGGAAAPGRLRAAPGEPADRRLQRGLGAATRSRSAARTCAATRARPGSSAPTAPSRSTPPPTGSPSWSTRRWARSCGATTRASRAGAGTGVRRRRTGLTPSTTTALFVLDALDPMTDDQLHAAADELVGHLARLGPDVRPSAAVGGREERRALASLLRQCRKSEETMTPLPDVRPGRQRGTGTGCRRWCGGLDRADRRSLVGMGAVILGLHVVGFGVLLRAGRARAPPARRVDAGLRRRGRACSRTRSGCGTPSTPTTSPRSTTRPASCSPTGPWRATGRRPLSVGFWFSLGHSSDRLRAGLRALRRRQGAGRRRSTDDGSRLHAITGRRRRLGLRAVPVGARRSSTSSCSSGSSGCSGGCGTASSTSRSWRSSSSGAGS